MNAEVFLEHKQLLFKSILSLHPVLVLDRLFPHPHKLPLFEFLEEVKFLYVVV